MNIIIMGPAGSGKGTVSKFIVDQFKITHISTGDMFRENIANSTELGQLAKQYTSAGKLVPDEVTIAMLKQRLSANDCKNGFLLDGFPRNLAQAQALDELVAQLGVKIDVVLSLVLPLDLLVDRITGRRVCPKCGTSYHIINAKPKVEGICDCCGSQLVQRADDTKEKLMVRLAEHDKNTTPVIKYYDEKGLLKEIDAQKSISEVNSQVFDILSSYN